MKTRMGKTASIPMGLGLSLAAAATITFLSTFAISILLDRRSIDWANVGYWIMLVLLLAPFVGGKIAINTIKTQRILISLMSGVLYWMFLLCITALLFGGDYSSIWETGALIAAGSLTAALLRFPQIRYSSRQKRGIYR